MYAPQALSRHTQTHPVGPRGRRANVLHLVLSYACLFVTHHAITRLPQTADLDARSFTPHECLPISLLHRDTSTLLHTCMGDRTCLSARLLSRGEEGDHGATLMRTDRVVLNARLGVCTATLPPMGPLLACTHWRWRYWAARPTLWPVRAARAQ